MPTATSDTRVNTSRLEPFVNVLKRASGITDEQAKICVLYSLCTFRNDLDKIPILAVIGSTGTGKSWLLDRLFCLVKEPKLATATTYPTMRDEIHNCRTYFIHEGDKVNERLIQSRSDKVLSSLTYKADNGNGWEIRCWRSGSVTEFSPISVSVLPA